MFSTMVRRGNKKCGTRKQSTSSCVLCVFLCQFPFFFPTPLFEPRYYKHRKDFPIYVWSTKGHSLEEFLTLGTTQLFASKNSSKYYQTEKKKKKTAVHAEQVALTLQKHSSQFKQWHFPKSLLSGITSANSQG